MAAETKTVQTYDIYNNLIYPKVLVDSVYLNDKEGSVHGGDALGESLKGKKIYIGDVSLESEYKQGESILAKVSIETHTSQDDSSLKIKIGKNGGKSSLTINGKDSRDFPDNCNFAGYFHNVSVIGGGNVYIDGSNGVTVEGDTTLKNKLTVDKDIFFNGRTDSSVKFRELGAYIGYNDNILYGYGTCVNISSYPISFPQGDPKTSRGVYTSYLYDGKNNKSHVSIKYRDQPYDEELNSWKDKGTILDAYVNDSSSFLDLRADKINIGSWEASDSGQRVNENIIEVNKRDNVDCSVDINCTVFRLATYNRDPSAESNKWNNCNLDIRYNYNYEYNDDNYLYIKSDEKMYINNDVSINGSLKVGKSSSFDGSVSATEGFYDISDIRKKNIVSELSIDKCYDLVDKCQEIIYTLKDSPDKEHVGMIAQEVEAFFPEIVSEDAEGYKSLDYSKLAVVCLRLLKDIIDKLKLNPNK